MSTSAVIPRSPFIPRTAQPPYSRVENSTRAKCLCKIHTGVGIAHWALPLLSTIRPRGDLNRVNLPVFTISNQTKFPTSRDFQAQNPLKSLRARQ